MNKYIYVIIAIGLAISGIVYKGVKVGAIGQETCPQDNGWVKIDSNDLSVYPISGAVEYCFKAGSNQAQGCTGGLFDTIPQGGFTQPYCGLSHWSYRIGTSPSPSPSLVASPSPSLSPRPQASVVPSDSPNPSVSPSLSPSPEPSTEQSTVTITNYSEVHPEMGFPSKAQK